MRQPAVADEAEDVLRGRGCRLSESGSGEREGGVTLFVWRGGDEAAEGADGSDKWRLPNFEENTFTEHSMRQHTSAYVRRLPNFEENTFSVAASASRPSCVTDALTDPPYLKLSLARK